MTNNRKYPVKMFLVGLTLNFFSHYFYLFLPGLLLCFAGIWHWLCLFFGLAVLGLDLLLSVMDQIQIRKEALSDSDNPEFNSLMDALFDPDSPVSFQQFMEATMQEQEALEDRSLLERLTVYRELRDSIRENMTPEEMVQAFEKMCRIPVGDPDDLLFETGTYDFTGERLFYFSLVRQFQFQDEDEYVQLRLELTYTPSGKTRFLRSTHWGTPADSGFFTAVRQSKAFQVIQELPLAGVYVKIERT